MVKATTTSKAKKATSDPSESQQFEKAKETLIAELGYLGNQVLTLGRLVERLIQYVLVDSPTQNHSAKADCLLSIDRILKEAKAKADAGK